MAALASISLAPYLLLGLPAVTCAYAIFALWRFRRQRHYGIAVLVSGAALAFCIVALHPILVAVHTPSSFDAVGDGFGLLIEAVFIGGAVAAAHLLFFVILLWRVGPELPREEIATRDSSSG